MSNRTSFVLMPFSESLSEVYDFLIKGALEEAGYNVRRADDIKSQSNILEDIVKGIAESDLIIADLTDSNPNVYYELGIAHALGKKVILITQEIDELPFDLRSYRVISYDTHFSKMLQAKQELLDLATEAINGKVPFGNPVKDFAPAINIEVPVTYNQIDGEDHEELGILDHSLEIEEAFCDLTKIIEEVGTEMSEALTPEIVSTAEQFNSSNNSAKTKRDVVRKLASHMDDYSKFLIPRNEDYKMLLKKIESSLEYLLTGDIENNDEKDNKSITEFIESFESMEKGAYAGRQGFVSMLEIQKQLPKIEKTFNRSNKFMQKQLEQFIENIDQTISISSRARMLASSKLNQELVETNQ